MTADKSCATCTHANSDMICVNLNSEKCGQAVCERDSCEEWKGEGMSCTYCDIQKGSTGDLLLESGFDCEVGIYLYRNTSGEYFITQNMGDTTSSVKIIVCPACGEPLTEPAPLTLEQLWDMGGQPVFIKMTKCTAALWTILRTCVKDPCATSVYGVRYLFKDYEREWLAYDRQPKEQTL